MSKAREEYESILEDFDSKDSDVIIKADNYIQELYKDCKYWESSSDYYREKCNELEQQKEQMLEALIMATKYMKIQRPFMDYSDDVELYENNIKIIESVTGKSIEEVLK